ncbi:hypothetical protein CAXC1_300031 [Candidatus Xenohaliotis californiensis]|uniref:Uncharacterized protein n=1 Tax=Candidatus Xenohaliotis californiensis TaxID=84677 RepID=A0ABM9N8C3_9RICK|nr:hypothetical protein CAXC1_300031 [Candidatus Xenohaliotis californiensis]
MINVIKSEKNVRNVTLPMIGLYSPFNLENNIHYADIDLSKAWIVLCLYLHKHLVCLYSLCYTSSVNTFIIIIWCI